MLSMGDKGIGDRACAFPISATAPRMKSHAMARPIVERQCRADRGSDSLTAPTK